MWKVVKIKINLSVTLSLTLMQNKKKTTCTYSVCTFIKFYILCFNNILVSEIEGLAKVLKVMLFRKALEFLHLIE